MYRVQNALVQIGSVAVSELKIKTEWRILLRVEAELRFCYIA